MLKKYALCDHCLGRLFGWLSTGMTNRERGHAIKTVLSIIADAHMRSGDEQGRELMKVLAENGMFPPAQSRLEQEKSEYQKMSECYLCSIDGINMFSQLEEIKGLVVEAIGTIEYNSFLVGSVHPVTLIERQDELAAKYGLYGAEVLKSHFNRELGRLLQNTLGKEVNFERPDIVIIYNSGEKTVEIQINSIFIAGRYRKMVRGIPQSRWDCRECNGKGCERCNYTGRLYPDSISEYVSDPMVECFEGTGFKFHAAGREDIDALMLGTGRPFAVEVLQPRKRTTDLAELEREINRRAEGKIEVFGLKYSDKRYAQKFMREASMNIKEYEAIIRVDGEDVTQEDLDEVSRQLTKIEIEQRTPLRVKHRRSDLVRTKHIYQTKLEKIGPQQIKGFFRVQGGTYIKELISGDEGRTKPSVSGLLGVSCVCEELNVTAIYSRGDQNDKP